MWADENAEAQWKHMVPGTVAYWRFEGGQDGKPVPDDVVVRDQTGRGNDLRRVTAPGSGPEALKYKSERTVDAAPSNGLKFERGYTVEAFFRLPADFKDGHHGWRGLFARQGSGAAAGKTGDDPRESAATLSLSSYAGKVDRSFAGLLGDVRVADRPLNPREFMLG
ncbi:hypothetical protein GCM10027258_22940 [Amycolatopsis stemonae]